MIDARDDHSSRGFSPSERGKVYKYDGEGLAAFPVVVKGSRLAGAELATSRVS
jgi:hypothetical protein